MKAGDRVTLVPPGLIWDEPREPYRRLTDGRTGVVLRVGQWNVAAGDYSYYAKVRWDGPDERPSYFKGTLQLALLEVEGE